MTPTPSPSYCSASLLPFTAKTLKWFSIFTVSTSSPPTHLSLHWSFHPLTPPNKPSLNSLVASLSRNPVDDLALILPSSQNYFMLLILFLFGNTFYISSLMIHNATVPWFYSYLSGHQFLYFAGSFTSNYWLNVGPNLFSLYNCSSGNFKNLHSFNCYFKWLPTKAPALSF